MLPGAKVNKSSLQQESNCTILRTAQEEVQKEKWEAVWCPPLSGAYTVPAEEKGRFGCFHCRLELTSHTTWHPMLIGGWRQMGAGCLRLCSNPGNWEERE